MSFDKDNLKIIAWLLLVLLLIISPLLLSLAGIIAAAIIYGWLGFFISIFISIALIITGFVAYLRLGTGETFFGMLIRLIKGHWNQGFTTDSFYELYILPMKEEDDSGIFDDY